MNIYRVTLLEGAEFPHFIAEGQPKNIYYFSTYIEALRNGATFAKKAELEGVEGSTTYEKIQTVKEIIAAGDDEYGFVAGGINAIEKSTAQKILRQARHRQLFRIKRFKIGAGHVARSLNSGNGERSYPLTPNTIIDDEVDLTPTEKDIYQQWLSKGYIAKSTARCAISTKPWNPSP
tara:strand:- start:163 stop:693 length:531 start_codon:yes stop_codon:yes gene_type:complete